MKNKVLMAGTGIALVSATLISTTDIASALSNSVQRFTQGDQTCITSNGVPDHAMGQFPNSGNPNSFQSNEQKFCFSGTPAKTGSINRSARTIGVALNGVPIRPGTADFYDASSPRGMSRDSASGWKFDGMGNPERFGIDQNSAHVDNRGLYHYHGIPAAFIQTEKSTLFGYAADGFEIHYVKDQAKASWVLKPGNRATAPGGAHDGKFEQDWQYTQGAGNLDECNGATLDNGKYVYFATDSYPFFPRCHVGEVSKDFAGRGPGGGARGDRPRRGQGNRQGGRTPPPRF